MSEILSLFFQTLRCYLGLTILVNKPPLDIIAHPNLSAIAESFFSSLLPAK